jgi:transposase InsO family protein
VAKHPGAGWTLQQLREALGCDDFPYLIHDRDSIFESHLRSILKSWVDHYNHGRPHMALGPGVSDPSSAVAQLAT